MLAYALRRIALALPTLFFVAVIVFVLVRLIPGDPAEVLAADLGDARAVEQLRRELALDQPLPVQFVAWLRQVASGDLGVSIITKEPVLGAILDRFGVTAMVVLLATAVSVLVAVPAGLIAAWRQNSTFDAVVVTLSVLLLSVPGFWVGIMLILLFGVHLRWLPTVGYVSPFEDFGRGLLYLAMPVAAIVMVEVATILRMCRSASLEVLRQEYVTHARAKGLHEAAVLLVHTLPNAFGPTLTMIGLIAGSLLGGAAVIETVFALPGIGRLLVEAIFARDYPVVQGCLLLTATIYVVVNLIVDLLYPIFDPRVRL